MTQPTDRETIIRHLIEASDLEIDANKVNPSTTLREDLDIGSLQALTLVMDLEEEFGITVEDEEFEGLLTVGDVFDLVDSKR
ncbi:MAG: acyl carrier protein [Thermoanaerobaculia bacterium]